MASSTRPNGDDTVRQAMKRAEQDERQRGVVEVERVGLDELDAEERLRDALEAVLATGEVPGLVGDEEDHLGEREGHHGEVDPGAPHGEVARGHGDEHRDDRAAEDRHRERHAGPDRDEAGDVGRGAPEGGVAEAEQPGEARGAGRPRWRTGPTRGCPWPRAGRCTRAGRGRRAARATSSPARTNGLSRAVRRGRGGRLHARRLGELGAHEASSRPKSPAGRTRTTAAMRTKMRTCA